MKGRVNGVTIVVVDTDVSACFVDVTTLVDFVTVGLYVVIGTDVVAVVFDIIVVNVISGVVGRRHTSNHS